MLPMDQPLYLQIAESMVRQIEQGVLKAGDRAPSLRRVSRQRRVSMSTALEAYLWLEKRRFLEARPRSGFYVRVLHDERIPEPTFTPRRNAPLALDAEDLVTEIAAAAADSANVAFGA